MYMHFLSGCPRETKKKHLLPTYQPRPIFVESHPSEAHTPTYTPITYVVDQVYIR